MRKLLFLLLTCIFTTVSTADSELRGTYSTSDLLFHFHAGLRPWNNPISVGFATTLTLDEPAGTNHIHVDDYYVGGYAEVQIIDAQAIWPQIPFAGVGHVGVELLYLTSTNSDLYFVPYAGVCLALPNIDGLYLVTDYRYNRRDDLLPEHTVSMGPMYVF